LPIDIFAALPAKNFILADFLKSERLPTAGGSVKIFTSGIQAECPYVGARLLASLASKTCLPVEYVNEQGLTPFPRFETGTSIEQQFTTLFDAA